MDIHKNSYEQYDLLFTAVSWPNKKHCIVRKLRGCNFHQHMYPLPLFISAQSINMLCCLYCLRFFFVKISSQSKPRRKSDWRKHHLLASCRYHSYTSYLYIHVIVVEQVAFPLVPTPRVSQSRVTVAAVCVCW